MQHLSSKQTSPSPAAGLWRIVGCLTPEQTRQFTREIKLVSGALASERPRTGMESGAPAPEGVRLRHSQRCPSRHSGVCGCSPRWEAWDRLPVNRRWRVYEDPSIVGTALELK